MKYGKRQLILASLVLALGAAVYLNWSYEQEAGKTLGESTMVGGEDPLLEGTTGGSSSSAGEDGTQKDETAADAQGERRAAADIFPLPA